MPVSLCVYVGRGHPKVHMQKPTDHSPSVTLTIFDWWENSEGLPVSVPNAGVAGKVTPGFLCRS